VVALETKTKVNHIKNSLRQGSYPNVNLCDESFESLNKKIRFPNEIAKLPHTSQERNSI
jgi:hypothetical protein